MDDGLSNATVGAVVRERGSKKDEDEDRTARILSEDKRNRLACPLRFALSLLALRYITAKGENSLLRGRCSLLCSLRWLHLCVATILVVWTFLGWVMCSSFLAIRGNFPPLIGWLEISLTQIPEMLPVPLCLTGTTIFSFGYCIYLLRSGWLSHVHRVRQTAARESGRVGQLIYAMQDLKGDDKEIMRKGWVDLAEKKAARGRRESMRMFSQTFRSSEEIPCDARDLVAPAPSQELPKPVYTKNPIMTGMSGEMDLQSPSTLLRVEEEAEEQEEVSIVDHDLGVAAFDSHPTDHLSTERRASLVSLNLPPSQLAASRAMQSEEIVACYAALRRRTRFWNLLLLTFPALFTMGGVAANFSLAHLAGINFVHKVGVEGVGVDTMISVSAYLIQFMALCIPPALIVAASDAHIVRLNAFERRLKLWGLISWCELQAAERGEEESGRDLSEEVHQAAAGLVVDLQSIYKDMELSVKLSQSFVSMSMLLVVAALISFMLSVFSLGMDLFLIHAVRLTYCAIFMIPVCGTLLALSRVHAAVLRVHEAAFSMPLSSKSISGVSKVWTHITAAQRRRGHGWTLAGRDLSPALAINTLYAIGLTAASVFQFATEALKSSKDPVIE